MVFMLTNLSYQEQEVYFVGDLLVLLIIKDSELIYPNNNKDDYEQKNICFRLCSSFNDIIFC